MSVNNSECQSVDDEKVLTPEEIVVLAQKISKDPSVQVSDFELDDYSKEKIGFTGSHKSLKVTFQGSHADSPVTVNTFVKSLPKYDASKTTDAMYKPILMQESFFFEKIIPQLLHGYKSEKWCPDFYLTTTNSIIIEDLKFSGYRMLGEFYNNPVVLKSVLASLARFHSCSILAEARLSRQSKHPVTLNKHFKDSISELMFIDDGNAGKWYKCGVDLACTLAERLGHNPEQIREVFGRVYDMVKPSETYQNAICHGDLHINNVMFAGESPSYKSILIDFQIIRYAPMVTDILQFLHLNASRKFREEFQKELIEFYHSVLVETINIHDSTIDPPTLESILKAVEDLKAYGLIIACIYMPLALLASKDQKELTGNPEALFNFLFGNRLEIVLAHMEKDEIFKNLVESAIIELAEKAMG